MNRRSRAAWRSAVFGGCLVLGSGATLASAYADPPATPAGVPDAQRAWQHWTLNCQGCHRPDGSGSGATAPALAGTVAKFLHVRGGREYLARVPGVATSPLSDRDLAEVVNWMLWRFDAAHLPADFAPYTPEEIGTLRAQPLRIEASSLRRRLLAEADRSLR
jgi:mono/diheme cytochrome c family protein